MQHKALLFSWLERRSTALGLIVGSLIVVAMALLTPQHALDYINLPGLLVVVGGTLAAIMVSRPFSELRDLARQLPHTLRESHPNPEESIPQLTYMAELLRHGRLRNAEHFAGQFHEPLLRRGLQLTVDRVAPAEIANTLQWQIDHAYQHNMRGSKTLRTMAGFAPAFGMLGTLFGLVDMLYELGSNNIETIGRLMAFAIMTTLYGVVAANLFLKPLAIKLEHAALDRFQYDCFLKEGVLLIANRQHPILLEETLRSLITKGGLVATGPQTDRYSHAA